MIVPDTNVILRGVRSSRGASGFVLRGMLSGEIAFAATPALVLEYEAVLKRPGLLGAPPVMDESTVDIILDALCFMAFEVSPRFRFRPMLDDPNDDAIVECALAASARTIVSDDRHFRHPSLAAFGLVVMTPRDYVIDLRQRGATK